MRDENKTREQLISELQEMRERIAALEKSDAELKRTEEELLSRNNECQALTAELDDKYLTIKRHDSMLKRNVEELNEKNLRLAEYTRQLRRKKITIRILAVMFAIILVTLGAALYLGKVGNFVKDFYRYSDPSYRPMDSDREGKLLPTKTGIAPAKEQK
jgi:predicted RNase H-like nuclease (RuvC/YqgF family)